MEAITVLPTIDIAQLFEGEVGLEVVAEQIRQSFKDIGFAYIKNHPIPEALMERMFQAAKDFHALPMNHKMAVMQRENFRGYLPANGSQYNQSTQPPVQAPNLVEAFITMFAATHQNPDIIEGNYFSGKNQWPEVMPELKATMTEYARTMTRLSLRMMAAFTQAFHLPTDGLKNLLGDPTSILRLHRYPDISQAVADNQCSIGPHTDHGFITFVAQDDVGGLQICCPQTGNWVGVPYQPNTFIMNAGDMMQRLTNGAYRSAVHRVMNTSGRYRYSIPFFFEPNLHQKIDVLPQFVQNELPHYPSVIYGDYLSSRLKPNYKALQTK